MFTMFTRHARGYLRTGLLLSAIVAGSYPSGINKAAAQQWNLVGGSTVTTASGAYTNLVKDNSGNYYVSYYGGGATQGSVQKFDGSTWSFLGGQGVSPGFATYNGLGVTAAGEVYYSFQDGSNSNKLSVKKYTPGTATWSDAGVAISSGVVNYQNLRIIPSTNFPVVTFTSSGLMAKRYDGTSWQDVGALPVVAGAGSLHSLAIGSNDTVYVAVQIGTAYSVYKNHILAGNTSPWQLVGTAGFASGGSSNQFTVSLAIDAANHLYLAYRALATPDGGKIAVYKFDGASWNPLGNQLFSGSNVEHISIAVTAAGVPTVAFRENNPTDKTMVYTLNGSIWTSLGAASDNLGNYNALMLDNGVPVVAFCNSTAANGGVITVKKYAPGVAINSLTVSTQNNAAAAITVNNGTLQMQATVLPAAANQNVTWSLVPGTGNATISTTGLVTAQTNGTVWAKAVSVADATKKDSLQVTISNQVVPVTGVTVSTSGGVAPQINTAAGTLQMQAAVLPATANQAVTWSIVPGTGTATISATGLVTAQTNGTVWAKAVSVADATKKDSLQVTLSNQVVPVTSVTVSTSGGVAPQINTAAGTLQMQATVLPATANQDVTWSIVPGTGTATISAAGLVTAQTNGTVWAKAVAIADVTKKDSLQVTISNQQVAASSLDVVTLNQAPATITQAAGTLQLATVFLPANTSNQAVTWSIVPGTGTATISATGLVTAQTNGTVWAKAVSVAHTSIHDSLLVTISNQQGTGLDKTQQLSGLQLYPNPVTRTLTLQAQQAAPGRTIRINSLSGKLLQVHAFAAQELRLDMTPLVPGIYLVTVQDGDKQAQYRIVKQ